MKSFLIVSFKNVGAMYVEEWVWFSFVENTFFRNVIVTQ